jgi:ATP-dependent Lhr-like helicase
LLARYGVLFRELATLESPALRWSEVFRALRIMELSGEIVAGHFFEGLSGPQFLTPAALRLLRQSAESTCS